MPGRTSVLRPTAVNSILAEVRALQAQGRRIVSLMRGEPDFETPAHIVDAAVRSLHSGRTTYPDQRGEVALREAVAQKVSRENGVSCDPGTEVLITDGATLGIHTALMSLVGPGDVVLVPDPVYDAYQSPIRLTGAEPAPVRSTCSNGRFHFGITELEAAWTPEVRVLLINTPWNPVGTVFTRTELEGIADFVCRRNLMLISDEIYEVITYDRHAHISPGALSKEVRERCVLINSFSKTYAMTGWRLGYCVGPAELMRNMLLVLQQASRGPATFVQDAGVAALTGPQDSVREMVAEYARRRQTVGDRLAGLAHAGVYSPEGGFFSMVDIRGSGRTSDEARRHLLSDCGVAIVHGAAYGPSGEGMLRVSFASGGATLTEGLDLLREGLAGL